jgi:hypothetical protein
MASRPTRRRAQELTKADWVEAAKAIVYAMCVAMPDPFADEFWRRFDAQHGEKFRKSRDGRAFGGVMQEAKRLGWCVPTQEFRRVGRCHKHPRPVWRSLIYRP